jgi:beta-fructofuranosidase
MKKADIFIKKHECDCNREYKPLYHLSAPFGWINDPNGFCFYGGEWHLFYQYNPYSSKWGRMHWGHAKSENLCEWKHLPIALYPDGANDFFLGCFSGSAIVAEGVLYLMYTGVPFFKQHQLLAESEDGVNFRKIKKPVIPIKNRPPHSGAFAFRDPKMLASDGSVYAVIGASYKKGRQIALYKSDGLTEWKYIGSPKKENFSKGIFECPDLIRTKSGDILIYSVMYTETNGMEYQNLHSSVYEIGNADLENAVFISCGRPRELDCGADFYAPQTTVSPDGRIIMTAWMQMWHRSNPLSYLKHGYCGIFTLPRELTLLNGELYQKPVKEIYGFFDGDGIEITDFIKGEKRYGGMSGTVYFLKLDFGYGGDLEILLRQGENCRTSLKFEDGKLIFNREKSGYPIKGAKADGNCNIRCMAIDKTDKISAEIFVDKCSVEIFVNEKRCMSNTVYPYSDGNGISFISESGVSAHINFSTRALKTDGIKNI